MFKKSLQILVACALLTLAAIVAFALLQLNGPEDVLYQAELKLREGRNGEVVTLLNQTELAPSMHGDPANLARLWRLRYQAQDRLDNPAGALLDVRRLLQNGYADDVELRLEEIRLLARDEQGARARQAAIEFLEDHPGHARGLELAGEACQTAYRPLLVELRDTLDAEIADGAREAVRRSLLSFLYRPDGDPMVARAEQELRVAFEDDTHLRTIWSTFRERMVGLRANIQEGLQYFGRSLDAGDEPVAAFRAIATALEQSGRIDDLLIDCEIQRRQFDHVYVAESGARAAGALLDAGLPEAAIATVDRWLVAEDVPARAAAGLLDQSAEQLALTRALAAWRLRDRDEMGRCGKLVAALREHDLPSIDALHVRLAADGVLGDRMRPEQVERSLGVIVRRAARAPKPISRVDLVAEFAPTWIDALAETGATEAQMQEALSLWRRARADELPPYQATAEYLLSRGATEAALSIVDEAQKRLSGVPQLFDLRVRIARRHFDVGGLSGASLLAQCVSSRSLKPEISNPIGYVLCAEQALKVGRPELAPIALECARAAVNEWPRALQPRRLELRSALLFPDPEEAARTADRCPPGLLTDPELLALQLKALQRAGRPVRQTLRRAIALPGDDPIVQVELLANALEDAPRHAIDYLSPELLEAPTDTRQRTLVARALAGTGRVEEAFRMLDNTAAPTDDEQRTWLQRAYVDWLSAQARTGDDDALLLQSQTLRDRLLLGDGPRELQLRAAEQLADSHPRTAYDLLQEALPRALPEERNGARFALAGSLAVQLFAYTQAEAHWLAALGFADGQAVAERLARLLLLRDEPERAGRVYTLVRAPSDPALAARFGRLEDALRLLAAALEAQPADLLLHGLLSTFGQPSMIDWHQPNDDAVQQQRLELLAGLREPGLGMLCLPRADEMLRSDPTRRMHYLLLARASADSGAAPAAGRLHAELFRNGLANPVLWREAAYAARADGYATDPALEQRIMAATTAGATAGSDLTVAYGTKLIVAGFEKGGFSDMAKRTRTMLWQGAPQLMPYTDDDLDLIAEALPARTACRVIDEILRGPHAEDPDVLLRRFYALALPLQRETPLLARELRPIVARHLVEQGARADVVQFLLQDPDDERPDFAVDLLRAHLAYVAEGGEADDRFASFVDRLADEVGSELGTETAAAEVDALLAQHPTRVPLWTAHAQLRARRGEQREAADELRSVLHRARAPQVELEFLALAARSRNLTPADFERFDALPEALRRSPQGHYVAGLLALRRGKPEAASAALADAATQRDGAHLYYSGMASLQHGEGDDGKQAAVERFTALQQGYASSSLAQNAGSFCRQLEPR